MNVPNICANDITKKIGRRILILRKQKKISREELAFKVGVCPQQIYKYEMGQNRITVDRLFSVSVALDFRMHDFFHSIDAIENNIMSAMPN